MTRNTKIIIGVVAGLAVLCLIACGVGVLGLGLFGTSVARSVQSNPGQAAQVGSEIADFETPPGFSATSSVNILGIKIVIYNNNSGSSENTLFLLEMPTQGDLSEQTIQQMQQAMERQSGRNLQNVRTISTKTLTIRGKPAQEIIQEGTSSSGSTYRQMMVAFQGKNGLAMLSVVGPSSSWDQSAYDSMVQSIR